MTLNEISKNIVARVVQIQGQNEFVERLFEMGLYRGCEIRLRTRLPMGGALVIEAGSLVVAVREDEAKQIQVEAVG